MVTTGTVTVDKAIFDIDQKALPKTGGTLTGTLTTRAITVPTGYKVTLTDAATAGTDAVNLTLLNARAPTTGGAGNANKVLSVDASGNPVWVNLVAGTHMNSGFPAFVGGDANKLVVVNGSGNGYTYEDKKQFVSNASDTYTG